MIIVPDQQKKKPRAMMPAIPEIAKAYQNDPGTQLAMQAMQTGSSTAPVSGEHAWVEGIARALQGVAGGYMAKKQMQKYGADEADLVALRKARGQDMLGQGQQVPGDISVNPAATGNAPVPAASNIASLFQGSQGAPAAGQMPPPGQTPPIAPAPPGMPAEAAPMGAGGLARRLPPFSLGGGNSAPSAPAAAPLTFVDPLAGKGIPKDGYGPRKAPIKGASTNHTGQDYAAPGGTPVAASADGVVIRAWNDPKGGNSVLVRHPDGSTTGYAHLNGYTVKRGDQVKAGQPIGAVGDTGTSTGNHLHFTYRDAQGRKLDPTKVLRFGQVNSPAMDGTGAPVANRTGAPDTIGLPDPVARPEAPEAEAATQSRLLKAAARMMADGNRYESAGAQEMYGKGLEEQSSMDESAAARRERLKDAGYQADLGQWGDSQNAARGNAYQTVQGRINNAYATALQNDSQAATAGENAKNRAFEAEQNKLNRQAQERLVAAQIAGKKDTAAEKEAAKSQRFMQTPTGWKAQSEYAAAAKVSDTMTGLLDRFQELNATQSTGGVWKNYAPEALATLRNEALQEMNSISSQLALLAGSDMKGSFSDGDIKFLQKQVPGYTRLKGANDAVVSTFRNASRRHEDFARWQYQYMQDAKPNFQQDWSNYKRAVSIQSKDYVTFEEYMGRKIIGGKK